MNGFYPSLDIEAYLRVALLSCGTEGMKGLVCFCELQCSFEAFVGAREQGHFVSTFFFLATMYDCGKRNSVERLFVVPICLSLSIILTRIKLFFLFF